MREPQDKAEPRRRWFQFRLSTLFWLLLLIPLGFYALRLILQRRNDSRLRQAENRELRKKYEEAKAYQDDMRRWGQLMLERAGLDR